MRTRSIKKQVWLNSKENELLKRKCMKAGLSESAFLLKIQKQNMILVNVEIKQMYIKVEIKIKMTKNNC